MAGLKTLAKVALGPIFGTTLLLGVAWNALKDLLIPKMPSTGTGKPVHSLSIGNEWPQVDDPWPLLFGRPRIYPLKIAEWKEYDGNQENTFILLFVCEGYAQLRELRFGESSITSTAGVEFQEILPGQTGTLFYPWVYVSDDSQGIALQGGSLDLQPYDANVSFGAGGAIAVNSSAQPWRNAAVGDRFTVSGPTSNNTEFTIDTVTDSRHVTAHRTDGTPIVVETVDCTINTYVVVTGGASIWVNDGTEAEEGDDDDDDDADIVTLTFDPGDGMTGKIIAPSERSWIEFRVSDYGQAYRTRYNDKIDYELVAINGREAIVRPAPLVAETVDGSFVMVRRRFGGFPVCPPGMKVDRIGVNLLFQQGLFRTNDSGKMRKCTREIEVQAQQIDDVGNATGSIISFGETPYTARSRSPQRFTRWRDVPVDRWQQFVARSSPANDDSGDQDEMTLGAVMGRVVADGVNPAYADGCTMLMLKITATSALANNAENQINGIWQAMHPLLVDGAWTGPRPTSDIAPAWAALRRKRGFAVDAQEYAAADAYWKAKGWQYHAYLTGRVTLREATEEVLAAGDARKWYDWRRNVDTMWRDRLRNDPVLIIGDAGRDRDSMKSVPIGLVPEDAPTGVRVTYTDARTGKDRTMTVGDDTAPTPVTYKGVTSRQQAWELGNREWGRINYRRTTIDPRLQWDYVRLGMGDPILVQSQEKRWGQFAYLDRVDADYDLGYLLVADRPFEWSETGGDYVYLPARDLSPGAPIAVSRGRNDRELLFAAAPPGELYLLDAEEPTQIMFGFPGHEPQQALVGGVDASDDEVHAVVQAVLDSPEIFADPGPAPVDEYATEGEEPNLEIADFAVTLDALTARGTWTAPAAQVVALIEYQRDGATSWTSIPSIIGGAALWTLPDGGDYYARVRAIGPNGTIGPVSDSVLIVVAPLPLSVTVSPGAASAFGSLAKLYTNTVKATVKGGVEPVTGAWVRVSGSLQIEAETGSSEQTLWTNSVNLARGGYVEGGWRYEAVDAVGNTAAGPFVPVSIERALNAGPGGGGGVIP